MNENQNEVASSVKQTRTQWRIDNQRFVQEYQRANSTKDVATALGVPVSIVNSRASSLRRKGVDLKHFSGTRKKINVAELNHVISEVK